MSFGSQAWTAARAFRETRLEANFSTLRLVGLWCACALLCTLGALSLAATISTGHAASIPSLMGGFMLLAGGLAAWMAWRLRPSGRPTLRLDGEGCSHALVGEVAWEDVLGIELYQRAGQDRSWMLFLGTESPASIRQHGLARRLMPMRGNRLEFSLKVLDREPAEIHAAALALRDRVEPPRMEGWARGFTPAQIRCLRLQREVTEMMEADLLVGPTPESIAIISEKNRETALATEAVLAEMREGVRRLRIGNAIAVGFCLLAIAWIAWLFLARAT